MYLIMVYDVKVSRVAKVLKTGRKYLTWVQNSVFEGEITEAKFEKLKLELKKIVDLNEDSILFYLFRTKMYTERQTLGIEKGKEEVII